jgi:hypothetical protein
LRTPAAGAPPGAGGCEKMKRKRRRRSVSNSSESFCTKAADELPGTKFPVHLLQEGGRLEADRQEHRRPVRGNMHSQATFFSIHSKLDPKLLGSTDFAPTFRSVGIPPAKSPPRPPPPPIPPPPPPPPPPLLLLLPPPPAPPLGFSIAGLLLSTVFAFFKPPFLKPSMEPRSAFRPPAAGGGAEGAPGGAGGGPPGGAGGPGGAAGAPNDMGGGWEKREKRQSKERSTNQ